MDRPAQVLRDPSGENRWELVTRAPHPRLRGFVSDYEGYVESGATPMRRQEVPSALIPLIVNFGAPWRIAGSRDGAPEAADSFLAGLFETSSWVEATGWAHCVQINLTPIAAHAFLGLPMHELSNRVVALEDVLPVRARDLAERLADAASWEARFALLDDVIADRLADAKRPSAEVVWAYRALERSGGRVRIGALANRLGRSRRHLIARFREQVGLPPKTVARILRFERAVDLMRRGSGLAALAYECGYADQAHLNRDFRQFAGTTPGELARRLDPGAGVIG